MKHRGAWMRATRQMFATRFAVLGHEVRKLVARLTEGRTRKV